MGRGTKPCKCIILLLPILICLHQSFSPLPRIYSAPMSECFPVANETKRDDQIQPFLRRGDYWTVLVTVSYGFDDMFRNWWYWYSKLNLDADVVLLAEDMQTYRQYNDSRNWITLLSSFNSSLGEGEALQYDTLKYKKLVSFRATHILQLLRSVKKLIYTDIDTVWLRSPLGYLEGDYDFVGALDAVHGDAPYFCTGFFAFHNTSAAFTLLVEWEKELLSSPQLNQPIFNRIVRTGHFDAKVLSRVQFPSGNLYFNNQTHEQTVVVHNNFIQGKENKIRRFQHSRLWHK